MVTVGCEHSPIFLAYMDSEGFLTLDYDIMQSVLEWYNSLSKTIGDAYYQENADVFCFPDGDNEEWSEYPCQSDGTYLAPFWLELQPACPKCLGYIPCDCDFRLVNEPTLQTMEASILTGSTLTVQDIRDLIYTVRELQAQLEVEQS